MYQLNPVAVVATGYFALIGWLIGGDLWSAGLGAAISMGIGFLILIYDELSR